MMLSEAPIDLAGLRCLIVEDVSVLAETERRLLGRLGARVVVAASVQEAHRALATEPFDVVIVDIGLPDGDGAEVVLSALEGAPLVAVLVVSGIADRARDLELQAVGAVVMSKDALAEHLPRAVDAARRRIAANATRNRAPSSQRVRALERAASCSTEARLVRYAAEHRLTEREREVFGLAFQGLTDKNIGLALRISYSTVRAHWHRIATKTGCEGQRDVMRQFAHCLARALARLETERDAAVGHAHSQTCGCTD